MFPRTDAIEIETAGQRSSGIGRCFHSSAALTALLAVRSHACNAARARGPVESEIIAGTVSGCPARSVQWCMHGFTLAISVEDQSESERLVAYVQSRVSEDHFR
jgi:hypothetical protein